jgi:hypothetical protein
MVGKRILGTIGFFVSIVVAGCSSSSGGRALCTGAATCSATLDIPPTTSDCKLHITGENGALIEFDCPDQTCTFVSGPSLSAGSNCSRTSESVTCDFSENQQSVAAYLGLSNGEGANGGFEATCANGVRSTNGFCEICDPAI